MHRYRIAAIPGDGIGQEAIPAGLEVLQAVAARQGFALDVRECPWSGGAATTAAAIRGANA